jgi:hypothetical protein
MRNSLQCCAGSTKGSRSAHSARTISPAHALTQLGVHQPLESREIERFRILDPNVVE